MSNKYIRNIDEETLARQIDEVRKTFCEEKCESCPWKLENGKCLLITASNHASERYHWRLRNLKKHYLRGETTKLLPTDKVLDMAEYFGVSWPNCGTREQKLIAIAIFLTGSLDGTPVIVEGGKLRVIK